MNPAMNALKADQVYATDGVDDTVLLRLERARLAAGLSVKEHAELAGINVQTYINIRSSANPKPTLNVVEALAEAVGLKLVLIPVAEPTPAFSDAIPPNMALLLLRAVRKLSDGTERNARAAAISWLAARLQRP